MRLAVRGTPKDALRTQSPSQASLKGGLVVTRVLAARAPVIGLCFFISVNVNPERPDSLDARLFLHVVLAVAPAGPWTRLHIC